MNRGTKLPVGFIGAPFEFGTLFSEMYNIELLRIERLIM